MPQMAPMNWIYLFITFVIIFLIFNSMNYFMFKYESTPKTITQSKTHFNWKW